MSLSSYQNLLELNKAESLPLGALLPELKQTSMTIKAYDISSESVQTVINDFAPEQGWVCYRDKVAIENQAPSRSDLLQAEYVNNQKSLSILFLGNDRYRVQEVSAEENTEIEIFLYKDLIMHCRADLKETASFVVYRHWYKKEVDGEFEGRWQPFIQQFMGFTSSSQGVSV